MCGIAGYHGLPVDTALLERMNACQVHRGPDGDGILTDGPCGLAHRRLSIIDVAHGQQPMETADGRHVIAYNGEVYNYLDLRAELEGLGRTFATDSDTEVVLQAFAEWGEDAFDRFNGMFGLAIWDRERPAADPGARPLRHQAPLHRAGAGAGRRRRGAPLRERDQADPRQWPVREEGQRPLRLPLPPLPRARGRHRDVLRRDRAARPRRAADGRRQRHPATHVHPSEGGAARARDRAAAVRPGSGRGVSAAPRRVGAVAAAVGGARRDVTVGRARLQRGRGHHQPAPGRG